MEKSEIHRDGSATSTNGVATHSSSALDPAAQQEASAHSDSSVADAKKERSSRTPGLKIFDVLLYPVLTNVGVFAISVAATYLTSKGGARNPEGELIFGKVGEWFNHRGDWLKGKFMGAGMTENQADMSKMVAFSFIDGSLMAPVVKAFEDRREHIGRAIDIKLGTSPEDDTAYGAEPKQSWGSVLGGRLATVSIVVPTAVALDKTGLNDKLFTEQGKKFGHWLAKNPTVVKNFAKYDLPELGKIGAFEAFYTSVCTAGIYFTSRLFASKNQQRRENAKATEAADINTPPTYTDTGADDEQKRSFADKVGHKFPPTVTSRKTLFTNRLETEQKSTPSLA